MKKILSNNYNNIRFDFTALLYFYDSECKSSVHYYRAKHYNLLFYLEKIKPDDILVDNIKTEFGNNKYEYSLIEQYANMVYEGVINAQKELKFAWLGACIKANGKNTKELSLKITDFFN